jgi:hypothetical protein
LNNVFRHGFTQLFGVIVAHFDRLAFSLLDQLFLLISKRLIVIFEITKYDLRIPKLDQLPRLLETQLIHQRRGFISRRASWRRQPNPAGGTTSTEGYSSPECDGYAARTTLRNREEEVEEKIFEDEEATFAQAHYHLRVTWGLRVNSLGELHIFLNRLMCTFCHSIFQMLQY